MQECRSRFWVVGEQAMSSVIGRRFLLGTASALLTGAIATAMAQSGPGMMGGRGPGTMGTGPGMMGGGPGMMGGQWNTRSYLDALKQELAITPNQESAWEAYADTVSNAGEQMQGLHQTMFESMGTASWQERRTLMNQMFKARQQAFDSVHEAAEKLLPALDAAQRAKAQTLVPGLVQRSGMTGQRRP